MTVEIDLKIRECEECSNRCVSLGGAGVGCPVCGYGSVGAWTGNVQSVELPEAVADQYRDVYESEVVE